MNVNSTSLTRLQVDSASPVAPAHSAAPRPEADANTVPPADKIILYTSKDRGHNNPLTMTETPGNFVDTKGNKYKYTTTESPNVFKDAKERNIYVLDSQEHRQAIATLRNKADSHGKELRDTPLPKYVGKATALGAVTGGTIGSALGVPGALGGAAVGAAVVGGSAAAIANLILHKDQFVLRDKIAVLQGTGVLRNAETLRDACVHSSSGKRVALYECALSILGDTAQIAEDEASSRL